MSVHRLEELSTPALDALDRARTVVVLTVSPLEGHGPHLPLGVDVFAACHFAESVALRLVTTRPGWTVVLAPPLYLGSSAFEAVGTVAVRQRVVRDAVTDSGAALARAGFRYILVSSGHAGPGHLVALEEAAAAVSRRDRVAMASLTGHLAWGFLRGHYLDKIETALGRPLTPGERRAFLEDAHGGWWETSLMLLLRPELVDGGYRTLPPTRFSLAERLRPNYALQNGGQGYVGHPALADPVFAKATLEVLMTEVMTLVDAVLDGRIPPTARRSPFSAILFLRTNFHSSFWPVLGAVVAVAAAAAWWVLR